ncbi:MAG: hypothetical protein UR84_C0022G0002 [candidate division WS6 bacterium GW2011_GWD1_35_594]|nr:MAG: hypothetical protein UR43_C0027G0010 [candidate division TM6 bacterium GW2011_GWF2_33_332]KKP81555.1 MAG: hypothetical protein UR84_C0022G0002 [candidate division WS6 bacterium GW2011_GWD1_35_594]
MKVFSMIMFVIAFLSFIVFLVQPILWGIDIFFDLSLNAEKVYGFYMITVGAMILSFTVELLTHTISEVNNESIIHTNT